ncbi:MAG: iron-siderophore ABC transporter substrate-binding protein [Mycobacteriaceae bacterium]|nr:iron-siderophore ABC transporter substrate-binding protein [Mycobacteriaceae bacterium]
MTPNTTPAPTTTRSVPTPTTQIAGAGVLGNQRNPEESCAKEPAPADSGPPTRPAHNAAGGSPQVVQVPAEPQRIVVLSDDALDGLCALGLQSRVVAAALPDGATNQPSYLGATIRGLPNVGTQSAPELPGIAAAHPDLILGSQGLTPQLYPALSAIAPTVFTAAPGADWQENLRSIGAATARASTADALLTAFAQLAEKTGAVHDATHYQASIVELTPDTLRVYGANNFAASVLAEVGVDRPAEQRFTDKPYLEIGITDADLARTPDLSAADADIIYVSCASPAAARRAPAILNSAAWRKLAANRDNRVFVVNNEVWQLGEGVLAARGIVDDLRWINAPIN